VSLRRRNQRRLSGWGGVSPASSTVRREAHPSAVADAVRRAPPTGVIARGLGRAYGDAAQIEGGTVLDSRGLTEVGPVDTAARTIDVGAGVSLGDLSRRLAPQGWMLPVVPGTRHVTVGGALAADVHGKDHHGHGAFGATVQSFNLVTAEGAARVVTHEADRALSEATVGGMGLTGIVTSARLRVEPLLSGFVSVRTRKARDLAGIMDAMAAGDREARYAVAWLDLSMASRKGRGVLQFADLAPGDALPEKRRSAPAGYGAPPALPVPPLPGEGLARPRIVRALNQAFWLMPRRGERLQSLARFLHPLDGLRRMDRLYGRDGFLQYQFVVPHGQERVLAAIAERFASSPVTPTLAVLKRLGEAGPGMFSFPLAGWTLAVDLPATDARVFILLDELDEAVAEAGGRVYLAKDARLRPEFLRAMYPRLDEWRAVKQLVDPTGIFQSDLSRRLGLTGSTR
jgi:decaprenylphospho-beta-D-ribofuranose 2-oxidase